MSNSPRRLIVNTVYRTKPQPMWSATVDGVADLVGYGPAEADAVYDLYCQIDEREADKDEKPYRDPLAPEPANPYRWVDGLEADAVYDLYCQSMGNQSK